MLSKFLSSAVAKTIIGWWKAWSRDRLNRRLGAAEQREKDNEADVAALKENAKIDSTHITPVDAFGILGLPRDRSDDK